MVSPGSNNADDPTDQQFFFFFFINFALAKFTGYQYGGRPLGITFVKYVNGGAVASDATSATEPMSGITQDQIM